jgi:hypothetical protein
MPDSKASDASRKKNQRCGTFETAAEFLKELRGIFLRVPAGFLPPGKKCDSGERKKNAITHAVQLVQRRQNPAGAHEQRGKQNPDADDIKHD